ncbi:hypothetical protein [Pseudomonas umsongensis]
MKASIAVASLLALAFSGSAISAKAPSKSEGNEDSLSLQKNVLADGYFSNNHCETYIEQLVLPEQGILRSISRTFLADDNLIYITGGTTTVSGDFEKLFRTSNHMTNPALLEAKSKLNSNGYITGYSSTLYSKQKVKDAVAAREVLWGNYAKGSEQRKNINSYIYCKIAENVLGKGEDANVFKEYLAYSESRVKSADIGYFNVSADSAYYGKSVNTGNQFAEPKKWDGSRFFVIRASFKNLDTESRLPVEGSLFINYNGKDYEFDSVEPIMLEGYNIWFKKVNPLITMKTKIVYRIPNEIHGEVFWRPGRNPSDTKLWLGYIDAAKAD